ncbi:MAG: hypothetical protein WB797_03250, partial [Nocardioides sp.]
LDERLPRAVPWRPVMAAAAAAVVVVGGGAVALASHGGGDTGSQPASHRTTASSPTVLPPTGPPVPWRNLPATHPHVRHRKHGHFVTPYDLVSATGTIAGDLHPGDTLTFTAVLESSTDLPLDPCPDFNIAFGAHSWHTWQLNCAQVPYRDGAGRPFLPAFQNVAFEMRMKVPDEPGRQKVLWTLEGPSQMPGFYGIVRVE